MLSSLTVLRQTPQVSPARFLAAHPGCWIQYYDDTDAKDPTKAHSSRSFDLAVARRKQQERCAVCYSLQAFGEARTKEGLLCYRNLGVDADLIRAPERRVLATAEIDARKDAYLARRLLPFPLQPHWLVETRHGFHAVFRVQPQRSAEGIREAAMLNRRLVSALRGDENAVLLTQVLRVPGTYQFKDPRQPFLCRLLLDNSAAIAPYDLDAVRSVLDAGEVFHGTAGGAKTEHQTHRGDDGKPGRQWSHGLVGVPEGRRNATAAAVIGGILGRLPEHFWETAGWGGLKEWNTKNAAPLPERELRSVFESIARRERNGRRSRARQPNRRVLVRVELRVKRGQPAGDTDAAPTAHSPSSSPSPHADN